MGETPNRNTLPDNALLGRIRDQQDLGGREPDHDVFVAARLDRLPDLTHLPLGQLSQVVIR
jgi:hypothetical protein